MKYLVYVLLFAVLLPACKASEGYNPSRGHIQFSKDTILAGDSIVLYFNIADSASIFDENSVLYCDIILFCNDYSRSVSGRMNVSKDSDSIYLMKFHVPNNAYYVYTSISDFNDEYKSVRLGKVVHYFDETRKMNVPQKYSIVEMSKEPGKIKNRDDLYTIMDLHLLHYPDDYTIYFPLLQNLYMNKDFELIEEINKYLVGQQNYAKDSIELIEDKIHYYLLMSFSNILNRDFAKSEEFLQDVIALIKSSHGADFRINIWATAQQIISTFMRAPMRLAGIDTAHYRNLQTLFKISIMLKQHDLLLNLTRYDYPNNDDIKPLVIEAAKRMIDNHKQPEMVNFYQVRKDIWVVLLRKIIDSGEDELIKQFYEIAFSELSSYVLDGQPMAKEYLSNYLPDIISQIADYNYSIGEYEKFLGLSNDFLQISQNNDFLKQNRKSRLLKIVDYYIEKEDTDKATDYLQRAFSENIPNLKSDDKYLDKVNKLRIKNQLTPLVADDLLLQWDVKVKKLKTSSKDMVESDIDLLQNTINRKSMGDISFLIINVNDECLVCNVATSDFIKKQDSNLPIVLVSDKDRKQLEQVFARNIQVVKRSEAVKKLLNLDKSTDISGILIKNKKIFYFDPMEYDTNLFEQL